MVVGQRIYRLRTQTKVVLVAFVILGWTQCWPKDKRLQFWVTQYSILFVSVPFGSYLNHYMAKNPEFWCLCPPKHLTLLALCVLLRESSIYDATNIVCRGELWPFFYQFICALVIRWSVRWNNFRILGLFNIFDTFCHSIMTQHLFIKYNKWRKTHKKWCFQSISLLPSICPVLCHSNFHVNTLCMFCDSTKFG